MSLHLKLMVFLAGLGFTLWVLRLIFRNTMRPSFAVLWFLASLFLVSVSLLEPVYKTLATSVIGIADARHVIYVALIGFLLDYAVYLTIKLTEMSDRILALISHTAILEQELRELKKKS